MARLSFYPVGDSYLLVAVVAIVLVGLLAIGPARHRLSRRRRAALFALRLGSVLMVLLAMLRPTLVTTEINKQAATLIVLADTSRSMSVPDALGGRKTRYEAMRGSLDEARDGLRRLAENFEVKTYRLRPPDPAAATWPTARSPCPRSPKDAKPPSASVLEDVLRQEAGKRLLGVILVERRRPASLCPARRRPADGRRRDETPRLPALHRAVRPGPRARARPRTSPSRNCWSTTTSSSRTNWPSAGRSASTASSTARFRSGCCSRRRRARWKSSPSRSSSRRPTASSCSVDLELRARDARPVQAHARSARRSPANW